MIDDLDVLIDALPLAATQRHDVGPVVASFAEKWSGVLDGTEPDSIEEVKLRAVIAEATFLLAACSRLADDTSEEIALHVALEMAGAEVTESEERVIANVRLADAICAAVRFVSILRSPQITLSVADASVACHLSRSEIDAALLETATNVLRCLGISVIQSEASVAFVAPVNNPADWVSTAMAKLRAGGRPDLPLKFIAHHLHDMKNQVTAALLNAAEASRDRVNRFRHLASAEDCLERGRATCREVARAARHATEIRVSSFSLRSFLSEIVREAMVRAPSVSFSTFLDGADVIFEADRLVLRNTIENLLKNALRAVENSGEIRVESLFDAPTKRVIIEVSNSGQLAPEGVIESLRAGGLPHSTAHAGVGFGLVSVSRSAELHGGTFQLFNHAGRTHALLELPSASTQSTEEQLNDGSTITVG
jgi:signal transduction histidine kinase